MAKAVSAKQQANWDRFAREARARAKANRAAGSASRGSRDVAPDAAAAKRRRAAKKAAKTRASWLYRGKKAVKDHPVLSLLGVAVAGVAAHPKSRAAAKGYAQRGLAVARRMR